MNLSDKTAKKRSMPLGRLCDGEDVAEMVTYLASKGNYIMGSVYHVWGHLDIIMWRYRL